MLASSDPATFIALVLLTAVLLLALRLRTVRRQRRTARIQLATVTGHPSTFSKGPAWADRRSLADGIAHQLAGLGLVAERRAAVPIVRASGQAGEYVLTVTFDQVVVEYETGLGRLHLGDFPDSQTAVRVVAEHADLPIPA